MLNNKPIYLTINVLGAATLNTLTGQKLLVGVLFVYSAKNFDEDKEYDIYTSVFYYKDWIRSVMAQ